MTETEAMRAYLNKLMESRTGLSKGLEPAKYGKKPN